MLNLIFALIFIGNGNRNVRLVLFYKQQNTYNKINATKKSLQLTAMHISHISENSCSGCEEITSCCWLGGILKWRATNSIGWLRRWYSMQEIVFYRRLLAELLQSHLILSFPFGSGKDSKLLLPKGKVFRPWRPSFLISYSIERGNFYCWGGANVSPLFTKSANKGKYFRKYFIPVYKTFR